MRHWLIPFEQLFLGLWMLWQAAFFGPWIVVLAIAIFKGRVGPLSGFYGLGLFGASFFIDVAAILCFGAAFAFFRHRARLGARLSVASAVCYWAYMAAHLLMLASMGGPLAITAMDALDYPVAIAAALIAFGVLRAQQSPEVCSGF